jgi:predicted lipid-binding transport protein (Tim44 family)
LQGFSIWSLVILMELRHKKLELDRSFMVEIILLISAGYFFYQLYRVLGQRPSNDQESNKPNSIDVVVKMTPKEPHKSSGEAKPNAPLEGWVLANQNQLAKIKSHFSDFDGHQFINGVSVAFEMITKAYCLGDIKTLEGLLSPKLFQSFRKAIQDREKQGIKEVLDSLHIDRVELQNVRFRKSIVTVDVAVSSIQKRELLDSQGRYLDIDHPQDMIKDLWSFTKDMSAVDPTWFLTQARVAEE